MKWSRSELERLGDNQLVIDEQVSFSAESLEKIGRLRELKDVQIVGKGYFDQNVERFYVDMTVTGEMVVPCAITLEDIHLPLDFVASESFSFDKVEEDEPVNEVHGEILDLLPIIFQLILMEVPWKAVKENLKEYPKGDGWEIVREKDFERREKGLDPRLAKLKEFIPSDD